MIIEVKGNNNLIKLEGENFIYEKCYISIIGQKCSVDIATKTTIGSAHFFLEESNTSIIVGENCMLGRDIILSTTDFHSILDLETKKRINPPASVIIGNKVWIGTNVKIAKGASITDNSVVAQSSIVNKKFKQPNIIIGGIPAKIIKEQIYWSREKL